jgi:hypothetical protein
MWRDKKKATCDDSQVALEWRRRELHPSPGFRNALPTLWLCPVGRGCAGIVSGRRGSPRAGRNLAPPDALSQVCDHESGPIFSAGSLSE